MTNSSLTPLMKQYFQIKEQHQGVLLFFQVGDFYELFYEDAKQAATFLGITLTSRGKNSSGEPIPLCGVPVHTVDHYVNKLVKGGYCVALCDQLEPPRPGAVVKRGVSQVFTPGTIVDSKLLDEKSASYLFSFFPMEKKWGLLFGELLTGQLYGTVLESGSEKNLDSELARFFPDEVLIANNAYAKPFHSFFKQRGYFTTPFSRDVQDIKQEGVDDWISNQFSKEVADSLDSQESVRLALYYFYAYVRRNQSAALDQFKSFQLYAPEDFLLLDSATQANLELIRNAHDGSSAGTLFSVMDQAVTPMGSRMIKKWLVRPIVKEEAIVQRQDVVSLFVKGQDIAHETQKALRQIGDLERVVGRIALARAPLYDYLALKAALPSIATIAHLLYSYRDTLLCAIIMRNITDFNALYQLLDAALADGTDPDCTIKQGFDPELDRLRDFAYHSNQKIVHLEEREKQETGIQSLKIRYNQVQGYYIEITKTNKKAVPERYIQQQSLVGRERYTTPELRQLETEITQAKNNVQLVDQQVFGRVKQEVVSYISSLRKASHALAHLDALVGFATVAYHNGYVRPTFNNERIIMIEGGRHPVVETLQSAQFIPNDTVLNNEQSLWIITGPNMGGKSTYLRQVALISILAQCGSFVPARKANLSLLDRVFTRIGAGDNLAEGKSTFLVEMEETATICTQATQHSLVILDEVGRGTSTFDGLAIAQAVVEYIYTKVGSRCLFATHYHELTHLQDTLPGVVSYYAASKKTSQGIVFLYTIIKGVADGSFGVEVARLAQLPGLVLDRAQDLLQVYQDQSNHGNNRSKESQYLAPSGAHDTPDRQRMQDLEHHIRALEAQLARYAVLESVDFDNLSPKKAFDLVWRLKENIQYE